jgi:hypothetical protein
MTPEGNYLITYTVMDEAGNTAEAHAIFWITVFKKGLFVLQ